MTRNKYTNLLLQTVGCFISAAGIYSFAVASGVPVTGIAGLCAILYRLFGIPMGLSNVLINIPIILFSYKLLGRSFFARSVYCMALFALFTDYLLPQLPVYQGDRLLATICAGYGDGYARAASKYNGEVSIRASRCKLAGLACMDQMMADVTDVKGVSVGDEVTLFGGREVPIMEYADWSDTNRNEAISRVTARVPRLYMRGGEVVEVMDYME